jgi:hypothetical protein
VDEDARAGDRQALLLGLLHDAAQGGVDARERSPELGADEPDRGHDLGLHRAVLDLRGRGEELVVEGLADRPAELLGRERLAGEGVAALRRERDPAALLERAEGPDEGARLSAKRRLHLEPDDLARVAVDEQRPDRLAAAARDDDLQLFLALPLDLDLAVLALEERPQPARLEQLAQPGGVCAQRLEAGQDRHPDRLPAAPLGGHLHHRVARRPRVLDAQRARPVVRLAALDPGAEQRRIVGRGERAPLLELLQPALEADRGANEARAARVGRDAALRARDQRDDRKPRRH